VTIRFSATFEHVFCSNLFGAHFREERKDCLDSLFFHTVYLDGVTSGSHTWHVFECWNDAERN